jgi:hypothetical protein
VQHGVLQHGGGRADVGAGLEDLGDAEDLADLARLRTPCRRVGALRAKLLEAAADRRREAPGDQILLSSVGLGFRLNCGCTAALIYLDTI